MVSLWDSQKQLDDYCVRNHDNNLQLLAKIGALRFFKMIICNYGKTQLWDSAIAIIQVQGEGKRTRKRKGRKTLKNQKGNENEAESWL